jgi:hypothetical protein
VDGAAAPASGIDTPEELGAASKREVSVVGTGYTVRIGLASMDALLGCGIGSCCGRTGSVWLRE